MALNKAKALQEAERLVSQGKLPQAIKRYLAVVQADPRDLNLLNTSGDLCVRNRDIEQALKIFRKLAEAYTKEGFLLRAIAIHKKIAKLDPTAAEPLIKLAELYAAQGLPRESRELYAQALDLCRKAGHGGPALEIMRQLIAAEPANVEHRMRLAECCEAMGRHDEANETYLAAAKFAAQQGDSETVEVAIARLDALGALGSRREQIRSELLATLAQSQPSEKTAARRAPASESASTREEEKGGAQDAKAPASLPLKGDGSTGAQPPEIEVDHFEAATAPVSDSVAEGRAQRGVARLASTSEEVDLSGEWNAFISGATEQSPAGPDDALLSVEPKPLAPTHSIPDASTEVEGASGARGEGYCAAPASEVSTESGLDLESRSPSPKPEPTLEASKATIESAGSARSGGADEFSTALTADPEAHWKHPKPEAVAAPPPAGQSNRVAGVSDFASSLDSLFEELSAEARQDGSDENRQTHYDLGVAFREMGLLDEAIGEFQKVVKDAGQANLPPNFASACALLGRCFTDKKMPELAIRWYRRALDVPGVSPDAVIALQYELAVAYELAGDDRHALERFLEVYGQNISYRDVAEKVRRMEGQAGRSAANAVES